MNVIKTAILLVSFGTASNETGISALEQLETRIRDAFPSYDVYCAWTSERIRKKLLEQKHQTINSISEAFLQMKHDGVHKVIVQPTFVIDGEENQRMQKEALAYSDDFSSIEFGAPLLGDAADAETAAQIVSSAAKNLTAYTEEDLVVFMGHGAASDMASSETGTWKSAPNAMYTLVDYYLQQSGHSNMILRLMNEPDSIDDILTLASSMQPRTIILVPFMVAAGRHAQKDMAGDQETSWASKLTSAGYSVRCMMKGLGEYEAIQNLFIEHINRMI